MNFVFNAVNFFPMAKLTCGIYRKKGFKKLINNMGQNKCVSLLRKKVDILFYGFGNDFKFCFMNIISFAGKRCFLHGDKLCVAHRSRMAFLQKFLSL